MTFEYKVRNIRSIVVQFRYGDNKFNVLLGFTNILK